VHKASSTEKMRKTKHKLISVVIDLYIQNIKATFYGNK